jgi:hypothetical protein
MRNAILAAIAASPLFAVACWAADPDKTVDDLIAAAKRPSTPAEIGKALDVIGAMGKSGLLTPAKVDAVVTGLGELLTSPSPKEDETNFIRYHVVKMFEQIGPLAIGILPKLVRAAGYNRAVDAAINDAEAAITKKPDAAGTNAAAQPSLPSHNPPTTDELKNDLGNSDAAVRLLAAKTLALPDRFADGLSLISDLLKCMNEDKDEEVRRLAAGSVDAILNKCKSEIAAGRVTQASYDSWQDTYIKGLAAMLEAKENVSRQLKLFAAEQLAEFAKDDDRAWGALNSLAIQDDDVKALVQSIVKRTQAGKQPPTPAPKNGNP